MTQELQQQEKAIYNKETQEDRQSKKEQAKYLGALVPEHLCKHFKAEAALRGETMQEAITNAALLYVDMHHDIKQKEKGVACNG